MCLCTKNELGTDFRSMGSGNFHKTAGIGLRTVYQYSNPIANHASEIVHKEETWTLTLLQLGTYLCEKFPAQTHKLCNFARRLEGHDITARCSSAIKVCYYTKCQRNGGRDIGGDDHRMVRLRSLNSQVRVSELCDRKSSVMSSCSLVCSKFQPQAFKCRIHLSAYFEQLYSGMFLWALYSGTIRRRLQTIVL
jgi:hypothetical protein